MMRIARERTLVELESRPQGQRFLSPEGGSTCCHSCLVAAADGIAFHAGNGAFTALGRHGKLLLVGFESNSALADG